MNISEMHVWFRQYAQQMGLQNVRAILPEQIDLLINTSIQDVTNEIINGGFGNANDRIITDNSKLPAINSLRTLYRTVEFNLPSDDSIEGVAGGQTVLSLGNIAGRPLQYKSSEQTFVGTPLYYVDFSVNYADRDIDEDEVTHDYQRPVETKYTTRLFPVRIIDDMYLADVLNDWILAPRFRSPIMTVHGHGDKDSVFTLYLGETNYDVTYKFLGKLRCGYIKTPATVRYLTDVAGNDQQNVDCDLPEHLHIPVLKHAVDLYRVAVSGSLYANQQAQQQQAREGQRNEARPNNEGQ